MTTNQMAEALEVGRALDAVLNELRYIASILSDEQERERISAAHTIAYAVRYRMQSQIDEARKVMGQNEDNIPY